MDHIQAIVVHPRHRENTVVAESLRAFSITNSVPILWMTEDSATVARRREAAERARKAQEEEERRKRAEEARLVSALLPVCRITNGLHFF